MSSLKHSASKGASDGGDGVTFACQRCCQPLKIHSSLENLETDALRDLTSGRLTFDTDIDEPDRSALNIPPPFDKAMQLKTAEKDNLKVSESETNGNGFLVIGEARPTIVVPPEEPHLKYKLQVTSRLFDILSDQSEVNHPLCEECADFVIDEMDCKLRQLEEECKDYRGFLESLEKKDSEHQESTELKAVELHRDVEALQLEETSLLKTLEDLDKEHQGLQEYTDRQRHELERISQEEQSYWQEYNNLKRTFYVCDDELQSVNNQLRYSQAQLDKLKRTNVFNATFHIWHSGQFGTINGFRLGRLPDEPVEWSEINAAWGQAVLLLHSLVKKIGLEFKRFKLVPYGNHSFLESLEDKSKELPLYGSGGFRFFWNTKFDSAMVAFLDCLQQFKEEVERGDAQFCLPYKMDKGKIEDTKTGNIYSIRIQFNSEEQWTKALKFMLTNLKWALAWVSTQFPKE